VKQRKKSLEGIVEAKSKNYAELSIFSRRKSSEQANRISQQFNTSLDRAKHIIKESKRIKQNKSVKPPQNVQSFEEAKISQIRVPFGLRSDSNRDKMSTVTEEEKFRKGSKVEIIGPLDKERDSQKGSSKNMFNCTPDQDSEMNHFEDKEK
jgi:hypothetical protein